MDSNVDQSSVAQLNEALRAYRRLLFRVFAIFVGGIVLEIVLVKLSMLIAPPYGVYIFGEGLGVWGLIVIVVLLIAELWVDGRAIGKALNDRTLKAMPAIGVMSAPGEIARRANAIGMEWSGFYGPLRPQRKR